MSIIIRLQNLPLEANSLDIRRFFQDLHIPDGGVHIVGGNHGDAFIAFGTDEDARQAMERNGNMIKGSRIKLLLSSRNEMQRVIETARNQSRTGGGSGGGGSTTGSGHQSQPPPPPQQQLPGSIPPNQPPGPQQQPGMVNHPGGQYPPPMQHQPPPSHQYQQQPMNQSATGGGGGLVGGGFYHQHPGANNPTSTSPYQQQQQQQQPGINDHSHGHHQHYGGYHHRSTRSRSRSRTPPPNRTVDSMANMRSGLLGSLPPLSSSSPLSGQPPSGQQQSYPNQNNNYHQPATSNHHHHHQTGGGGGGGGQIQGGTPSNHHHHQQHYQDSTMSYGGGGYGGPSPSSHRPVFENDHQTPLWSAAATGGTASVNQPPPMSGAPVDDYYRKMDSMQQQQQPPPSMHPLSQVQQQLPPPSAGGGGQPQQYGGGGGQYPPQSQPQHQLYQQRQEFQPTSGPPPPPQQRNMFSVHLYDLPLNVRTADLIQFFHPLYLNEDNVKIYFDEKGYPTGVALVRFSSPREFDQALGYNNRYMGDRIVRIRPWDSDNGSTGTATINSQPPPSLPPQSQPQPLPPPPRQQPLIATPPPQPPVNDPYRSENFPPYRNAPEDISSFQQQRQFSGGGPRPRNKDLVLFMKGLPFNLCNTKEVELFFEPLKLAHIDIEMDPRGRLTGNAFVEFHTHQDFVRGLEYNMRHMGRRYIELIRYSDFEKFGPQGPPRSGRPPPPPPPPMPPPGLPHHSSLPPSHSVDHHRTHCVSVRGLSKYVSSRDLKAFFQDTFAVHIMLTPDGMNAGEAFVEFSTRDLQTRALQRDGTYFGQDRITVQPIPYDVVRNSVGGGGGGGRPHSGGGDYGRDGKTNGSQRYSSRGGDRRLDSRTDSPMSANRYSGPVPPFNQKNCILLAKNVSLKSKSEDLCVFFRDYGITSNRVRFRDANSDDCQEALISFHTKQDAERAKRVMDNKYLLDRRIHLHSFV